MNKLSFHIRSFLIFFKHSTFNPDSKHIVFKLNPKYIKKKIKDWFLPGLSRVQADFEWSPSMERNNIIHNPKRPLYLSLWASLD